MCRFGYRLDTFPQGKTLLWGKPNLAITICYGLDGFVTPNPSVKFPRILEGSAFGGDWVLMTELLWIGWVRNILQEDSSVLPAGGSCHGAGGGKLNHRISNLSCGLVHWYIQYDSVRSQREWSHRGLPFISSFLSSLLLS